MEWQKDFANFTNERKWLVDTNFRRLILGRGDRQSSRIDSIGGFRLDDPEGNNYKFGYYNILYPDPSPSTLDCPYPQLPINRKYK